MSSLSPLHWQATQHFDERYKRKESKVIFEPARTHHLGLQAQNFDNPIFTFGCFSLKAVQNSCKLLRILQFAKFLLMYPFIHTNTVFVVSVKINFCQRQTHCTDDQHKFKSVKDTDNAFTECQTLRKNLQSIGIYLSVCTHFYKNFKEQYFRSIKSKS